MSTSDETTQDLAKHRVSLLAVLDEVELEIEKLVAGGDGFGRIDGLPIFVPRSAPGDRLKVHITERRPQYARAEIMEVLRPGPGRRTPPCPHFSDCGGCDLQHLEDGLQTDLKVAAARETLLRIGGLQLPEGEETIAGSAWGYRLRTQLHLEPTEGGTRLGYFERGSHRLVDVSECPVLAPGLERFVKTLRRRLPEDVPRRLDVAIGDQDRMSCAPAVGDLPRGSVTVSAAGHDYDFDARTFFQGHRELVGDLIRCAVGDDTGEVAFDLYAGVGLFSVPLAEKYQRVVAVEGDPVVARYLRRNAQRERGSVEVLTKSVGAAMRDLPAGVDRVLVDPPRDGLGYRVRADLFDRYPARLTYVSCHPAVLARDLKHLCRIYRLEKVSYVDLFPQTGHIEVVAQPRVEESASGT